MQEFKVIEIVDKTRIIINYGKNDGAIMNQKVQIYNIGREVIDPDTKCSLGTWDIIKDTLEIEELFDDFSICRKPYLKAASLLDPFMNSLSSTTKEVSGYGLINVDDSQITNNLNEQITPIKVGDLVKIV